MNIQSEIEFFADLGLVDKARFIARLICEIAEEAKVGNGDGSDAVRYKFANEMSQRLARFTYQLLGEDLARPQDDVVIRMLLGRARRQECSAHHAQCVSPGADQLRELRYHGVAESALVLGMRSFQARKSSAWKLPMPQVCQDRSTSLAAKVRSRTDRRRVTQTQALWHIRALSLLTVSDERAVLGIRDATCLLLGLIAVRFEQMQELFRRFAAGFQKLLFIVLHGELLGHESLRRAREIDVRSRRPWISTAPAIRVPAPTSPGSIPGFRG